jgi:mRNA interferase RelE/StbE
VSEGKRRVDLAPAAQRQLRRLPPGDAARLRGPNLALAIDAHPPGSVKLADTAFWRLRVGELRVIYAIDDAASLVIVLKVARRSESTYRRIDRAAV